MFVDPMDHTKLMGEHDDFDLGTALEQILATTDITTLTPANPRVSLRDESHSGSDNESENMYIEIIMDQVDGTTREQVAETLARCNGDVVDAIFELSHPSLPAMMGTPPDGESRLVPKNPSAEEESDSAKEVSDSVSPAKPIDILMSMIVSAEHGTADE